jgi:hypothetical protein
MIVGVPTCAQSFTTCVSASAPVLRFSRHAVQNIATGLHKCVMRSRAGVSVRSASVQRFVRIKTVDWLSFAAGTSRRGSPSVPKHWFYPIGTLSRVCGVGRTFLFRSVRLIEVNGIDPVERLNETFGS